MQKPFIVWNLSDCKNYHPQIFRDTTFNSQDWTDGTSFYEIDPFSLEPVAPESVSVAGLTKQVHTRATAVNPGGYDLANCTLSGNRLTYTGTGRPSMTMKEVPHPKDRLGIWNPLMLQRFEESKTVGLRVLNLQNLKKQVLQAPMTPPPGRQANTWVPNWSTRSTPFQGQHRAEGVCHEAIINLCNTAGAKPWMFLPYGCGPVYAAELGKLYARMSKLPPTVEWANEVWNTAFSWANDIRSKYAGDYYAAATAAAEDLRIFLANCPGATVAVMGKTETPSIAIDQARAFMDNGIPVDYFGCAMYAANPGAQWRNQPVPTPAELVAATMSGIRPRLKPGLAQHGDFAASIGARLAVYEGNSSEPGYPNPPEALGQAVIDAQSMMGPVIDELWDVMVEEGVHTFAPFATCQDDNANNGSFGFMRGFWGKTPGITSPKFDALVAKVNS